MISKEAQVRLCGKNQDDIKESAESEKGYDGKSIPRIDGGRPIFVFFDKGFPPDGSQWKDVNTINQGIPVTLMSGTQWFGD